MSNGVMERVFRLQGVMTLKDIVSGGIRKMKGQMRSAEKQVGSLSAMMSKLYRTMMPIALVASVIIGAFGVCTGATIETQKALGELASVGITDMKSMTNEAEKFSDMWAGTTKPQFLAAAYDIKSGISSLSDAAVAKFTALAALTGKATKSTVNLMTSLFATAYGIYKDMYANMSDMKFGEMFSAGISAAVQMFKTTGGGMQQAISQLGATAASSNVPLKEQLTVLGMLQATMTGSEAGTKYKALMQSVASAGKKLGLAFLDAKNQLKSLPDIIDILRKKYGSTLDEIEKMQISEAFGTKEAIAVIDLFYNKVDAMRSNIAGIGSAMGKGTSFTEEMAMKMNMDLGSVLQILSQRFNNLKEVIGNAFVPILIPALNWISRITKAVKDFIKTDFGQRILRIAGAVAASVVAFTALASGIAMIGIVGPLLTAGLSTVVATLAAVGWPLLAIIGVVGALYYAFKKNLGGIAEWWHKAVLVFRAVWSVFATMKDGVGVVRGELADEIEAHGLVGLVTKIVKIGYRIQKFFSGFKSGLSNAFSGVFQIFQPVLDATGGILREVWNVIAEITSAFTGSAVKSDVKEWKEFGNVLGKIVAGGFKIMAYSIRIALWPMQKIMEYTAKFLKHLRETGKIREFARVLKEKFTKIKDWISKFSFKDAGRKMMESLKEGIESARKGIENSIKGYFDKFRNMIGMKKPVAGLSSFEMMRTMPSVPEMDPGETHNDFPLPRIEREYVVQKDEGKSQTPIHIENLNLPDVKDAQEFYSELKNLVEGFA